jgi:S-adenosylmethionine:tRNA ribosyltransferase-isomerase
MAGCRVSHGVEHGSLVTWFADMDVREFDFDLPPELIAQEPAADRGAARLLHLRRDNGHLTDTAVTALPRVLRAGDLIVVNNTRVFPARLIGRRVPSGGAVECLLIQRLEASGGGRVASRDARWEALMHPGQKLKPGAVVVFEGNPAPDPDAAAAARRRTIHGEVLERRFNGRRVIRLWTDDEESVDDVVDAIGHVPLPPYIKRDDRCDDRERYQTIFARARGSVAAPTAGLHFNAELTAALGAGGIEMAEITLHVGYGTFQPVRVERVEDHQLEAERYSVGEPAAAAINLALDQGRRVIAVGTTTTRTLETVARAHDGRITAGDGATGLFIHPGFEFRVASGLLTNFHLPRSSLLMLVAAFAGRERVMAAYQAAIARRYRFYSYGDAMLIV